jgi:hypothetical protein
VLPTVPAPQTPDSSAPAASTPPGQSH